MGEMSSGHSDAFSASRGSGGIPIMSSSLGPRTTASKPPPVKLSSTLSLSDYASSRTTPADRSRRDLIVISAYSDDTYSDAEQRQFGFYDLEADGALRGGGKVSLFTRRHFGLVLNYAGIGLLYGALPATILPFMKYYLGMESYQVQAATAIVNTAWSFKTFGGIISDSFPIFGYRRKSYMIFGWLLCLACLFSLGFMDMPGTYYKPGTRVVQHPESRHQGWKYALTMAGATFGYFFVNVASDGMVVELAQREPMDCRGETQTIIYATRSLFMTAADLFIGSVFSDKRFGGTFNWSLDYNVVMIILGICSIVPLLGSIFLLTEDKEYPNITFRSRCRDMWRISQSRAVWQVLLFELIAVFCLGFSSSASVSVATNWARVEPFQKGIANVVTGIVYTASLYVVKIYLLQVNWVRGFCFATVWIIFIRFIYVSSTVFDIVRNQYFWFYMQTFSQPALALRFLLFTFPITEIAEIGYEGTTFGLVTTFHNMAIPLGVSAYKWVDSYFDITDDKVHADTSQIRWTVYYTYMISWAVQLSSLLSLFLLPRQKLEMQQLRYYGSQSRLAGTLVLVMLVLILIYSTSTNVLSLFPTTACLRIAGGNGCPRSS